MLNELSSDDLWQHISPWVNTAWPQLVGLLLCLLFGIWLARWVARHEALVKSRWRMFSQWGPVAALRKRYALQIAFARARLSPQSYMGLHFTLGIAALLLASVLFGIIAEDIVTGDPLVALDLRIAAWLHAHAAPGLTRFLLLITNAHGTLGIVLMAAVFAGVLAIRREWFWLLTLAIAVPGGMLFNVALKYAFHRTRPSFDDPLLSLATYSFPSGHTAGAMLFYGVLAAFLVSRIKGWRLRVWCVFGAALMVALVGFSRIYLGVHYLSDVLAAALASVAWLALCVTALHTLHGRRAARLADAALHPTAHNGSELP